VNHAAKSEQTLRTAPEEIVVDGVRLRLECYLWRDFMPIAGTEGKPMLAVVKLVAQGGAVLPRGVDAGQVWLVGERTWSGVFLKEERPEDARALEKVFRDGPKWKPGSEVDVVVEVLDPGGGLQLLRASRQKIHQTS